MTAEPASSAMAADAALLALGDSGSYDDDDPDILTQTIADHLALMLLA